MTDFLLLLAKINLAMAGAILIVAVLRRPMRAAFHAPVAYALWLLVPAAALASLLPPRMVAVAALPERMQIPVVMNHALPTPLVAQAAPVDWSLLLFACWLVGAGGMLLVMVWQQRQFYKAELLGAAGPAVTGFFRPRIVIPSGFTVQFSTREQAAILAHEQAHLARQDARINAVVALTRCLCWFNPVVHVGALWLRKDQELACDAAALRHVSRVDYANALLKSQMRARALPLGCSWPGGEHPLTERVALLKRAQPNAVRQAAGVALIVALTTLAGMGAWAAEPARREAAADKAGPSNPIACPHTGFCGKFFYSQQAEGSGPAFYMTVESERQPDQVVMHYPFGMALADSGRLDWAEKNPADHKTITLNGNVRLATGLELNIRGNKLVFDARTGLLELDGKVYPSGMPKYRPCTKNCKQYEK